MMLDFSSSALNKSLARLSSGSRIVAPSDDSGGLGVSMSLQSRVLGSQEAIKNVANAISFSQTQDGYLGQIGAALDRMSTLSILAQDTTKTGSDLANYDAEFQTLSTYVQSATAQDFNGVSLFSGSALNVTIDGSGNSFSMSGIAAAYLPVSGSPTYPSLSASIGSVSAKLNGLGTAQISSGSTSITLHASDTIQTYLNDLASLGESASYNPTNGQIAITVNSYLNDNQDVLGGLGLNPNATNSVWIGTTPLRAYYSGYTHNTTFASTGTSSGLSVASSTSAATALQQIKTAITQLAADRATVGASMSRLSFTSEELSTEVTNLSAATSRITDVDVAAESTNYARENIQVQFGTQMLAQANSLQQSVLRLLG